ncbi:AMP-binding protein [Nonomuraea sp. NEAU-A123]|uniref:AMP-binding protein n=1 Tax=Nonomuraea sp. NEAU-A123 TaxID=2839649 RepID=UPI001BE4652E|nr:AMP-binding protein [Nonomuraea sp. NEAU-A123]MBT2235167.1 AMP-binding protein [Nonomuraea sp. NEAU-A123]
MAIIDFFDRGWRQNPSGAAYIMHERTWTYEQAGRLSCRIAHALLARGFARETKAAVLSPNDPVAWICVLGIWRAGMTWVPLNPAAPVDDNGLLLDRFDCEVVFFHSSLEPVVEQLRPMLPGVRQYVRIDSLADFVEGADDRPPAIRYDLDDVVAVAPTGGTTGLPKGVMNTHRSFAASFAHQLLAISYRADEPIVNLAAAPMTHASGLLTMPVTARGGTVVILDRAEPAAVREAIPRHRITELFLPPTVIYRMLELPGIDRDDFPSLRYLLYGAAPMSTEKLARAIGVFGPVLMECYGQMEAPAAISFLRPEEHFVDGRLAPPERLSSCGRPYPLISVEIRDAAGRPVESGVPGEICVRGDLVMKGYYNAPDLTAETVVDGWLRTGDIGFLDEGGYLHITDREKDMIISGGFNVYPSEVEQVIWAHPAVQDCVVVGVPHDDWGEAVKAVVELNPGEQVTEGELIALCRQRLGGIRAPKTVDFVRSLPRSANGKVLKKAVREPYWAGRERRV